MTDLAWRYDPETMRADLPLDRTDSPALAGGLATAVLLSPGLGRARRRGRDAGGRACRRRRRPPPLVG